MGGKIRPIFSLLGQLASGFSEIFLRGPLA
jgi:hypothetical protein